MSCSRRRRTGKTDTPERAPRVPEQAAISGLQSVPDSEAYEDAGFMRAGSGLRVITAFNDTSPWSPGIWVTGRTPTRTRRQAIALSDGSLRA